jgi:uncharacterized membrane protein YbaN (DUF454 family)
MIKRFFSITLGILFLILGLIGALLPFMPGTFFAVIGIILISPHHGHKMSSKIKEKIKTLRKK